MKTKEDDISSRRRDITGLWPTAGLAAALLWCAVVPTASADNPQTLAEAYRDRQAGDMPACVLEHGLHPEPESGAAGLVEKWGVEVTSIRLTAHTHMIDYRYRVVDAAKADELFKRQIKPQLVHQETGKVLVVPDTAKVGPLRNSNIPQDDKVYWMFFGNADHLVKKGDLVTIVIGDFVVDDLVVE